MYFLLSRPDEDTDCFVYVIEFSVRLFQFYCSDVKTNIPFNFKIRNSVHDDKIYYNGLGIYFISEINSVWFRNYWSLEYSWKYYLKCRHHFKKVLKNSHIDLRIECDDRIYGQRIKVELSVVNIKSRRKQNTFFRKETAMEDRLILYEFIFGTNTALLIFYPKFWLIILIF